MTKNYFYFFRVLFLSNKNNYSRFLNLPSLPLGNSNVSALTMSMPFRNKYQPFISLSHVKRRLLSMSF